jgi:hypothetical protein
LARAVGGAGTIAGTTARTAAPIERAAVTTAREVEYEIGDILPNGTVAGANPLGAAPNLVKLGKKFGLNASSATSRNVLENLNMPVHQFISQNRKASILREFPAEYLNRTVGEALKEGGTDVSKLLTDLRFAKNAK